MTFPPIPPHPPKRSEPTWMDRLSRVESRNVTYADDTFPVFWKAAEGGIVQDTDDNLYLDFTSAFGVALAGHRHPKIVAALHDQTDRLIHGMGDVHPSTVKVELLEKLTALAPWSDGKAILSSTGSEAVEAALKTAHKATGRPGVIAFSGAYHGLTLGALAVTDRSHFRRPFVDRLNDHVTFIPFPRPTDHVDPNAPNPLELVAAAVDRAAVPVGAIIVEPIQGRAGVRPPLPGFLPALADYAQDNGIVLIFDEIFTGFGRTGQLFAGMWEGVTPDLMCVGKCLGGGLPISACIGPTRVMDAWPPSEGEAIHTSTFLGHPLSAASALAFLQVLEEEKLVAQAAAAGETLKDLLRELIAPLPTVRSIRGKGLMMGVELSGRTGTGVPLAVAATERAIERGLLLLPAGAEGEVIELIPPAVLTEEQLRWGVEQLADVLTRLEPA